MKLHAQPRGLNWTDMQEALDQPASLIILRYQMNRFDLPSSFTNVTVTRRHESLDSRCRLNIRLYKHKAQMSSVSVKSAWYNELLTKRFRRRCRATTTCIVH